MHVRFPFLDAPSHLSLALLDRGLPGLSGTSKCFSIARPKASYPPGALTIVYSTFDNCNNTLYSLVKDTTGGKIYVGGIANVQYFLSLLSVRVEGEFGKSILRTR